MAKKYKYFTLQTEMLRNKESQEEIGRLLGISSTSVRNKLDDKNKWTISEIDALCKHYNKDFYELFEKE